eukprot:20272-Heterococcus_DN1.PRE.3
MTMPMHTRGSNVHTALVTVAQYSIAGNRYALVNVELLVLSRSLPYRYHKLSVCSTSSRVTKLPVCVARVVRNCQLKEAREYESTRSRAVEISSSTYLKTSAVAAVDTANTAPCRPVRSSTNTDATRDTAAITSAVAHLEQAVTVVAVVTVGVPVVDVTYAAATAGTDVEAGC